jgi:hypothetical protein
VSVSSVLQGTVTDLLCEVLAVDQKDNVVLAYRLKRATYAYRKGHLFITDIMDCEHVFGEVDCFICRADDNKWHILLKMFDYVSHFHSYAVREKTPLTYHLLTFSDLSDHHAVFGYMNLCGNRRVKFVRLPYHVF